MSENFFGRETELARLQSFVDSSESGFLIVRGRRRIGKTWLLAQFARSVPALSFQGDEDSSARQLLRKFAEEWKLFSGDDSLSIIRVVDLSWLRAFRAMTTFFRNHPDRKHVIVFDEIQWIAKRKSGFLGHLKEAWVDWEQLGNVKVIICGSSYRFFASKTASETSVLHRMRTVGDLRVLPFSLSEIRLHYFPEWTQEEICLVFMMTGGVPYYLARIPRDGNFIRAINKTFFTRDTIFLDEFREVINLEFTRESARTAEAILAALGQDGSTLENIRRKTSISNESTVRTMIGQLLKFEIVTEKTQAGAIKANRRGSKYYIQDPFLSFYFQILKSRARRIRKNVRANLFRECIGSKTGYYIEDFSGKAFELLAEWVLRRQLSPAGRESILAKLNLQDDDYEVGHHWVEGATQVDLIIENETDRESRLLELKWISGKADLGSGYLDQVREKAYLPPKGWTISYHLLLSGESSTPFRKKAKTMKVQILGLSDLFAD
jgi:AAA+ ATPase superfamily predicted ATPase